MLPAALSWSGVVTVLSMKLSTAAVSSSQESVTLSKCFSGFTQLDAAQCSANRKAEQVNPFTEGILKSGTLVLVINNKRVRHRVTESSVSKTNCVVYSVQTQAKQVWFLISFS